MASRNKNDKFVRDILPPHESPKEHNAHKTSRDWRESLPSMISRERTKEVRTVKKDSFASRLPAQAGIKNFQSRESSNRSKKFNPYQMIDGRLKIIIFAVLFFAVSLFILDSFARVVVMISPEEKFVDVNAVLQVRNESKADLTGEVVLFEEFTEAKGRASGFEELNERARGQIMIYNAYSSLPQILVRRTRFETSDGKIYRITKGITVPGAHVVDGKIEPSSIEVEVVADESGEEYNIDLSDFTIPGFKGSIKYKKFYARAISPMTGGFVGKASVVEESDVMVLRQTLESSLRERLDSRMSDELPEGFFAPDGAISYKFSVDTLDPEIGSRAEEFHIRLRATLQLFLIRQSDVENELLKQHDGGEDTGGLRIHNFNELTFEAYDVDFESSSMALGIQGQAQLVWNIEEKEIKERLALAYGNAERLKLFQTYPQIRKAALIFKPSWWRIFPRNAAKVIIQENLSTSE